MAWEKSPESPAAGRGAERARRAVSAYRWRGIASAVGGLMFVAPGCASAYPPMITPGVPLLVGGLLAARNARRMHRALHAHPWVRCLTEVHGREVTLRDPTTDALVHLKCALVNPVRPKRNGPLWWSGTAERGGVLCSMGGADLTWVTPARRDRA
ncbi:hypothetical protein AB0J38_20675 [Streptomyces sp. NPDC050095]|uniref:hypothetical protein n=2 Tax=unclassified Streptomyces TaxID=2593676 RepID=UPI0034235B44